MYFIIYNIYNKHYPFQSYRPSSISQAASVHRHQFQQRLFSPADSLTLLSSNLLLHLFRLLPSPSSLYRYQTSSISPNYYAPFPITVSPPSFLPLIFPIKCLALTPPIYPTSTLLILPIPDGCVDGPTPPTSPPSYNTPHPPTNCD